MRGHWIEAPYWPEHVFLSQGPDKSLSRGRSKHMGNPRIDPSQINEITVAFHKTDVQLPIYITNVSPSVATKISQSRCLLICGIWHRVCHFLPRGI